MSDQASLKYTDKRTIDRYMRTGQVDEKTWEKHLKSLPDVAEKAAAIESSMSEGDETAE